MKSEINKKKPVTLKGKQKKILRGLAHHLDPVVYVGKDGLSDNLLASTLDALKTRELIKIKLGQNCDVPKKEAAEQLAAMTGAALVQLIGKTIILYLPNKDLKAEQRVNLPRR
jgi:RNA-binding protein